MTPPRIRRLFSLGFRRADPSSEVREELNFHFTQTIESLMVSGMSRREAEAEAKRRFGDRAEYQRQLEGLVRRRVTARRASEWLTGVLKDVGYAVRTFRRTPTFTLGVVGTLAVAIGATTVMLSVVDGVLLRPLPFPNANRIVRVFDTQVERNTLSSTSSPANFIDWRERQTTFTALAAHNSSRAAYTDVVPAEDIAGFRVSAEWFDAVGIRPMLGRAFTRSEEIDGNDRVVIVSFAFWQRFLDADSSAIGTSIGLDGTAHQVVGIMPPGFTYPADDVSIWRPLSFDFDVSTSRGVHYIYVIGRLGPGQTLTTAETDLRGIMASLREAYPERLEGWDLRLVSMKEWLLGDTTPRLLIFLGAVILLFLVASVNVTNMMMVKAVSRGREMAVRAAMGAGRWRLTRLLMMEGLTLSIIATVLGILLGVLGLQAVIALAPSNIPRIDDATLNGGVVAVVTALAILLGALLGVVPALIVSRGGVESAVMAGGRGITAAPAHNRLRQGFVVAQIALAMLLAIGAGLLVRSFDSISRVDPGYHTEQAWTATIGIPGERYPDDESKSQFFAAVVERVSALPGVRSAAVATQLPLEYYGINFSFWRDDQDLAENERPGGDFRVVSPGYFATMGIPVVRGRDFDDSDRSDTEAVILIDQTLADRYFQNEDPIGQLMHISYGGENSPRRIVGVVGEVRQRTLDTPPDPGYYLPLQQVSWSGMRLVVGTDLPPLTLTEAIRHEVAALDPLVPVRNILTLEERFDSVVASPRFSAFLLTIVAIIAVIVAAAGIFGVTSYSVAQRDQEIGVRMALGAEAAAVRRSVSRGVVKLAVVGVAVGYVTAIPTTHLLEGLLFDVSPTDGLTFVLTGLAFLVVAWLGGYLPARRASAVDPVIALRAD